jgi:transposase
VRASLRLPWSSGQDEGQVNRLKLLKRSTYGRAKLDLLRRCILLTAGSTKPGKETLIGGGSYSPR